MNSKLSILLLSLFSLMSLSVVAMQPENENKKVGENQVVQYDPQQQAMQFPVRMLSNNENLYVQVIADPTWKHKKRYPLISYPPQFTNFKISYKMDDFNFLNTQNIPTHQQIREKLEDITIKIQDEHSLSAGNEEKKRTMKTDLTDFGKHLILVNKSGILNWFIENVDNSQIEKLAKNKTIIEKVLQINKQQQLENGKDESWTANEQYYREKKLNWFERNPFSFASIIGIGIFAFCASPFIFNKLNLLSFFTTIKNTAEEAVVDPTT